MTVSIVHDTVDVSTAPPIVISPVLVCDEFFGDYTLECNLCEAGTGRADYRTLVDYAARHVSSQHPDVIVIESEEGISYV
jgi:hypothetical protein